jgi:hypothetical protein
MRTIRGQQFELLTRALAYLLGGVFLCTAVATGVCTLIAHIFGVIFVFFAFFLVIVSILDRFIAWANSIHTYLFLALFVTTVGRLMIIAIGSGNPLYIALAIVFSLLLVVALVFEIVRQWTNLRTRFDCRIATAIILRSISIVLSLWALFIVICGVNIIGGPIFYLALGLVCLSISSLL